MCHGTSMLYGICTCSNCPFCLVGSTTWTEQGLSCMERNHGKEIKSSFWSLVHSCNITNKHLVSRQWCFLVVLTRLPSSLLLLGFPVWVLVLCCTMRNGNVNMSVQHTLLCFFLCFHWPLSLENGDGMRSDNCCCTREEVGYQRNRIQKEKLLRLLKRVLRIRRIHYRKTLGKPGSTWLSYA